MCEPPDGAFAQSSNSDDSGDVTAYDAASSGDVWQLIGASASDSVIASSTGQNVAAISIDIDSLYSHSYVPEREAEPTLVCNALIKLFHTQNVSGEPACFENCFQPGCWGTFMTLRNQILIKGRLVTGKKFFLKRQVIDHTTQAICSFQQRARRFVIEDVHQDLSLFAEASFL